MGGSSQYGLARGRSRIAPFIGRILPQEIVEQVIDNLSDARDEIKTCSLVCKAWLHRCREHLHRTVTIYHQYCRIHPSQVQDVTRLLSLPAVSAYTRELILEGKTNYAALTKTDASEEDNGEELFWRVLAQYSHVHTLRVNRLFWIAHSLSNKDRLCASFPHVTKLEVYMSDFVDAQEFLSFLTTFPQLTRLKVERVFWCESATEWYASSGSDPSTYRSLPADAAPGARLRHLQVQHCDVHNMVDITRWLSSTPLTELTSLHLSPPDGDDFTALPLYFRAIGASLEHLYLTLEFATKGETLRQAVSGLELCARLRSLTLFANFGLGRKFVKAANIFWPCVLILLDHVASTRLQLLHFECQMEDLESLALVQLDQMLLRPVFNTVTKVRFALADFPAGNSLQVHNYLRMLLPQTAAKGLLLLQ